MTAVDSSAAPRQGYHLIKYNDQWLVGRPILSVPGVRKLSDEEAAPFRKSWDDHVHLSAEAQADQAGRMKASEERHQKNTQIKFLMDQLHREVTRIAKSMPEDTVFASFTDDKGKVIGKLYQSGSVWLNSDEAWRVGGTAGIQRISEQAWAQTKDPKQARQIMVDQFRALLASNSQASVTLTGLAENPQAAFKADAPLLAIMDKISAIDPDFGSRFDDWRPEGAGGAVPQSKLNFDATPPKPGALPEGASRILTMSVDIEALKEKAAKAQAQAAAHEAWLAQQGDRTLDDANFLIRVAEQFKVVEATAKALLAAMEKVQPYAVIRDKQGKEVGRINQDGGFVTTDPRFHGLHSAVVDGQRSIVNGKHDRYEAIKKALGSTGRIELTGLDVDPQTLFPELRKAAQNARDMLYAMTRRTEAWA